VPGEGYDVRNNTLCFRRTSREVEQEPKRLLTIVGPLLRLFGFFFALYLLGMYVTPLV
jgi:hypothetical protein